MSVTLVSGAVFAQDKPDLASLSVDDLMNVEVTSYQIVFISASEEAHLTEILGNLGHNSVLTVSDIDRFRCEAE